MNKKQYNNVIEQTIKHEQLEQSEDSLQTARAIFKNMGVALPQGELGQVLETLKTDDYMGWQSCSAKEAQEAANRGTAAIGINAERIVVLAANDEEEPVEGTASVMSLNESTSAYAVSDLSFYAYGYGTTTAYGPYVDIPQDGNIGTMIDYMGYHTDTNPNSSIVRLREHARCHGRYSIAYPEYYAMIDGRMVIATKANIGGQLRVAIGDYVVVRFKTTAGVIRDYNCIIGEEKGTDASNIWGHDNGKRVVEMVYHDYTPPEGAGYNKPKNNPWGTGRVIRITKVGSYGYFG